MKKLAYLSILALSFTMLSCRKCQTCTTTVTQSYGTGPAQNSTSSQEYCGKNYDDAPAEGTTTNSGGGVTQTVVIQCSDK